MKNTDGPNYTVKMLCSYDHNTLFCTEQQGAAVYHMSLLRCPCNLFMWGRFLFQFRVILQFCSYSILCFNQYLRYVVIGACLKTQIVKPLGCYTGTFLLSLQGNIPGDSIWFECLCPCLRLCGTRSLQPYNERLFLLSTTATVVMTSEVSLTGPGLRLHYRVFNLSDRKLWMQERWPGNVDK